jgi:hypothetical protein
MTTPTPYQPFQPITAVRGLYSSVVQVMRLAPVMNTEYGMTVTWSVVPDVLDLQLNQPGIMACRLAIGYLRPGKDQPTPLVAGRPQDRYGVVYYDPVTDASGVPLVKAGDRFLCVSGPISGTWEMRNIPDQLQGYSLPQHCEAQVVEVAAQSGPGSPTPFPGGAP